MEVWWVRAAYYQGVQQTKFPFCFGIDFSVFHWISDQIVGWYLGNMLGDNCILFKKIRNTFNIAKCLHYIECTEN